MPLEPTPSLIRKMPDAPTIGRMSTPTPPPPKPAPAAEAESTDSDASPDSGAEKKAAEAPATRARNGRIGEAAVPETRKPEDVAKDATTMILERIMERGKRPKPEDKGDEQPDATDDKKDGEQGSEKKDEKGGKRKAGRPAKKEATPSPTAAMYADADAEAEEEPEEKESRKVVTTREDITKLAAESAVRALAERDAERQPPRQQQQAPPPQHQVPKALREEAEKYEAVQVLYPDQYAGRDLVKELVTFNTAAATYEKKWKSEHAGEDFSWDDDEHDTWMEENAPGVDPEHAATAAVRLKEYKDSKRVQDEVDRKVQPILEEKRQRDLMQQHSRAIYAAKADVVTKILRAVAPDIGDDEHVGALLAEPDKLAAEMDKDPVAAEVAQHYVREATTVLDLAARLEHGITPLNLKDPAQQGLQRFLATLEGELASLEDHERPKVAGRKFVTTETANRMKDRSGVYTVFDWDALQHVVALRSVNLAKGAVEQQEERHRKVAEARGWVEKKGAPSKEQKAAGKAAFAPAPSVSAASSAGKPTNGKPMNIASNFPEGLARKIYGSFR